MVIQDGAADGVGCADTGAEQARFSGQAHQIRDQRAQSQLELLAVDADDPDAPLPGPGDSISEYGITPGEDGKKPLHWFDVPSRPIFSFARIWRATERGNAYGFLVTELNAIVAPIHPKAMPVVLHNEDYERWLKAPWEELKDLVAPYPSQ